MLKNLIEYRTLNMVLCVISVLLSGDLYGQNLIESKVNHIIECASNGQYTKLRNEVDSTIGLIEQNIEDGHVLLNYTEQFLDIVKTLPVDLKAKSIPYIIRCNELAIQSLKSAVLNQSFAFYEEYLDYLSYSHFVTYLLVSEAGDVDMAEYYIVKATEIYNSENITQQRLNALLELWSYYFSNQNCIKELKTLFSAFNVAVGLYGRDSEDTKEIFNLLMTRYYIALFYLQVKYCDGQYKKIESGGLPILDYQTASEVVILWKKIRKQLIKEYGNTYYNESLQHLYSTEPRFLQHRLGTEEYDNFISLLMDLDNHSTDDFTKKYKNYISTSTSTDLIIESSEIIKRSLENKGYINIALDLYSILSEELGIRGLKDEEERIKSKIGWLAYKYGFDSLGFKYCKIIESPERNNLRPETLLDRILLNARLVRSNGNYEQSMSLYNMGINLIDKHSNEINDFDISEFYSSYAMSLLQLKDYNAALSNILKAKDYHRTYALKNGGDPNNPRDLFFPISIYPILANIYIDLKMYDEAFDILKKCEEYYLWNLPHSDGLLHIYSNLMYLSQITGDMEADVYYCNCYNEVSMNYFHTMSFSMTAQQRSDFWHSQMFYYCLEVLSNKALNNKLLTELCFDRSLIQKGFLVNYTKHIVQNIQSSDDKILLKYYQKFNEAEKKGYGVARKAEAILMERYSMHPEFIDTYKHHTWRDLQKVLTASELAIEFTICYKDNGNTYAAILLKKDWPRPIMIELCNASELHNLISEGAMLYKKNDTAYSYIWQKLEPYFKKGDNIYFAPHGLIHQLNIEVLCGSDGKPMNKKCNLYRLSSTGNLVDKREDLKYTSATLYGGLNYDTDTTSMVAINRNYVTSPSYQRVSIFNESVQTRAGWSYLPGTAEEVRNVGDILGRNKIETTTYTDETGTEESLKALSGNSTPIIHIATHGFYLEDKNARRVEMFQAFEENNTQTISPLKRSGLMFSGGQHAWLGREIPEGIDDGVLTAEEIAGMNLTGTDLLVLSACQTGLGEITNEGVEGLQRGFKIAGVNTIIMSLWEVSDAATEVLMTKFYSLLIKGKTKREAFDAAVEAVKKEYPSPEYWAAFIMLD